MTGRSAIMLALKPCLKPLHDKRNNMNLIRTYANLIRTLNKECGSKNVLVLRETVRIHSCSFSKQIHTKSSKSFPEGNNPTSSKFDSSVNSNNGLPVMSKKDQLKRAVKDYGATVIVFHIAISLASLGFFYSLVSR